MNHNVPNDVRAARRAWRRVWLWERKHKTRRTFSLRWYDDGGHIRTESVGPDPAAAEIERRRREYELNFPRVEIPVPDSWKRANPGKVLNLQRQGITLVPMEESRGNELTVAI